MALSSWTAAISIDDGIISVAFYALAISKMFTQLEVSSGWRWHGLLYTSLREHRQLHAQRGLEYGQEDQKAEKMMNDLRGLGPQAPAVYFAMVEQLAKEEVGRANRESLLSAVAAITDEPPKFGRICKLENCEQQDVINIAFAREQVSEAGRKCQVRVSGKASWISST